jgi:DNA-binding protein H-NS
VTDKRREFQEKQKEDREDFLSEKPKGDRRSHFLDRQSTDRTRFNSDLTDERDRFEDSIKEQRKNFEAEVANRRTEFKQEFPEYQRVYKEMKLAEEKEKAEKNANPPPYGGWPYKPADAPAGAPTKSYDVNQGGQGWPASDPAELNQVPNPPKSEQ